MSSTVPCAVLLLACALTFSAAQTSCRGRCGAEYYRGYTCQCDYTCLVYGECCKDFESLCTTKNSCKGRCGETFKRGRLCSCDSDCMEYKQCCPDYKIHCDAEEEINGATSATAPVKTSSCHNINDNNPKEPTVTETAEQPSTFSEANSADDHLIPLDSPTSYPRDNLGDDMYSKIFPNDEFSNDGVDDPEASPTPESSSGFGASTADLLGQVSTEPTLGTDTLELTTETAAAFSQTETSPSDDDNPITLHPTTEEAPTESTDVSDVTGSPDFATTLPQSSTAADRDSSQPTSTSVPQTGPSASPSTPELNTEIQAADTIFPSDEPEVTTVPFNTQDSVTVLENSQVTTIPASSTLDSTTIPEETTSKPNTEDNSGDATTSLPTLMVDLEDPSTSVSPAGPENLSELDAVSTLVPSSTAAVKEDTADDVRPGVTTTADPIKVSPQPTDLQTSEPTSKPQDKPDPHTLSPAKATSKPVSKPVDTAPNLNTDNPRDYQADDSNDTNLCSGRPVSAVTTLRNGTMVVFRGHYFWFLDRNRVPGPARGITQVWGVPSPVDTVFTRCNCQGKTYIFKGGQYWRFENDVLDPGYPKVIRTGFDGLQGHITAALSVPQHQTRREAVYFFKRGGFVQKYSYQFGTRPTCSKKVQYAIHTVRNRMARQAVSILEPAINIRTSWRGFPTTITAAVSVPSNREPEGYKYFVFSRSQSYTVRMDGERPVIATPKANASPQNNFFKCPKKV